MEINSMGLGGRCLVFILNYPLVAYVKVCKTRVVGLGILGPRLNEIRSLCVLED